MSGGQLLRGVNHADYHADLVDEALHSRVLSEDQRRAALSKAYPPRLSRSLACTLLSRSPLHAWHQHPKLGGGLAETPTRSLEGGSLIHALLLGEGPKIEVAMIPAKGPDGKFRATPEQDLVDALTESVLRLNAGETFAQMATGGMIPAPNWKTDDAQRVRDEARARGFLPVLAHDLVEAQEAVAQIRTRLETVGVPLAMCEPEITILWESGGVACKTRPDLVYVEPRTEHTVLGGDISEVQTGWNAADLYDLKVVEEINEAAFEATVDRYGLDMQHAAAVEGLTAVYPELAGRLDLLFVVVEKKPPYDVMVKGLSRPWQSLGESRWNRAKKLWKECLESNRWSGIGLRPPAELRPYLLEREMIARGEIVDPDWAEGAGS